MAWTRLVEEPARAAKLPPPKLVVLTSTYRQFFQPLVEFVLELRDQHPTRDLVVVIPDLVVTRFVRSAPQSLRGRILRAPPAAGDRASPSPAFLSARKWEQLKPRPRTSISAE